MEACFKSRDYEEGRKAFMEKRKPVFTGLLDARSFRTPRSGDPESILPVVVMDSGFASHSASKTRVPRLSARAPE